MTNLIFNVPPPHNIIPPFMVVGDAFTEKECESLIVYGKNVELTPAKLVSGDVTTAIRSSDVKFIEPTTPDLEWLFARLKEIGESVNDRVFGFDLQFISPPQYTRYNVGGYYDWHEDTILGNPTIVKARKLSATLFLNAPSAYDGGQFQIQRKPDGSAEFNIEPLQGSMVFFPSFMSHRVAPVTRGERNSLVVWYEGDMFK